MVGSLFSGAAGFGILRLLLNKPNIKHYVFVFPKSSLLLPHKILIKWEEEIKNQKRESVQ